MKRIHLPPPRACIRLIILPFVLLLASCLAHPAAATGLTSDPPAYEVTVDSVFTVLADDVSRDSFFFATPKVYALVDGRKLTAKVLTPRRDFIGGLKTIRCQWRHPLGPGTYDLFVLVNEPEATPVKITTRFQVMAPVIDSLSPCWGTAGTTVTVAGRFFGSRPGQLRLQLPGGKRWLLHAATPYRYPDAAGRAGCSAMNLETGASELTFTVPGTFREPVPAMFRLDSRTGLAEACFYPDRYDLREHGLITPVKNQCGRRPDGVSDVGASVGLCWAFASLAAFESSLLKQGWQTDPAAETANLSPWYLGNYIQYNGHPLAFNSDLWLDPIELSPATTYGYLQPDAPGWGGGGGHWTCDYINSSGHALVLWQDSPMPNDAMTRHEDLRKPDPLPSCGYLVKDLIFYDPDDFANDDAFRYAIKQALLTYGGVQSYIHLDAVDLAGINMQTNHTVTPPEVFVGHRFMDKANSNYFCYDDRFAGDLTHAICIAGWDNARTIDLDGHTTTGAWLVKDSSGANAHDQGYFWVAFDDQVLLKSGNFAFAFVAHPGSGYQPPGQYQTHAGALSEVSDNFYWYDQFAGDDYAEGKDTWACAQFTVSGKETLKAVGLITMNRDQAVTLKVFRNTAFPPDMKTRPLLTQSLRFPEKGYHLVDLTRKIPLRPGDNLVVAIGFAYAPDYGSPMTYVTDRTATMPATYWASFDHAEGWSPWTPFPAGSAFYLQAVMAGK